VTAMPGIPPDYFRRLYEAERRHWWPVGMRRIAASLLAGRLRGSLLDAGCGTGGFLAWAAGRGRFDRLCGSDLSPEAVELARQAIPEADIRVAPLHALPFEDSAFDLALLADVLQHVHEDEVEHGLRELRRVLRPGGMLLVRTNGGRRGRRARADWRLYDPVSLTEELRRGGFRVERLTHANALLSLLEREPRPPTESTCGIPVPVGAARNAFGSALLSAEARWLRRPDRRLPFGHTLFALARPEAS